MNSSQLRAAIARVPRYPLAHRPTPLEPLHRLSSAIGKVEIVVKRDDCTGLAFGGNKARHNEFILAEAQRQGADLFVWGGGVQSNNCRQTAAACAKAGIECHLVLTRGPSGANGEVPLQGNFLIDHLVGASYEFVDVSFGESLDQCVAEIAARFESRGRRVFRWNRPIVTPLAAIGYVECAAEIVEQSEQAGFRADALYVSSSGSTGAGLQLGLRALGRDCPVRNVAYVRWEWDTPSDMAAIANRAAELLAIPTRLAPGDMDVTFDHIAPGYGRPSPACWEAVRLAAGTEGILLDPVYTGKALAALIDDVRTGRLAPGRRAVFVHTGGAPALFAYSGEIADGIPRHVLSQS